ncbi:hypothetical protein LCGC14_0235330 [marine sediment metagenome]|uniref:HD domain-containing protein n=1 Tax=marine sediment metagenome TaxID=412755 RepID=A0A0F9UQ82_9ZZZZ
MTLEDIAYHLSMISRWNGVIQKPFSVLEHCLYCEELVRHSFYGASVTTRLYALLHDAHEAYTGDIHTALKKKCPYIEEFQQRLDIVIYKKFGIEPPDKLILPTIEWADRKAKLGEAYQFLPRGAYKAILGDKKPPELLPIGCSYGDKREKARQRYTNTLKGLLGEIK